MEDIKKFTKDNGMWDGWCGCTPWPEIKDKENDGYREPVYVTNDDFMIICDSQCAQAYFGEEIDQVMNKNINFANQEEAIRFLKMINPKVPRDFEMLGFEFL